VLGHVFLMRSLRAWDYYPIPRPEGTRGAPAERRDRPFLGPEPFFLSIKTFCKKTGCHVRRWDIRLLAYNEWLHGAQVFGGRKDTCALSSVTISTVYD